MFEEAQVCMLCGRPVDGLVYCSDECESLDVVSPSLTSPSLSATSSVYPSPYIASTQVASDVPALLSSTLGHRAHHSISSSNSSTGWSAVTDQEDEKLDVSITVANANTIEQHPDMLSEGAKSPGLLHPHRGNGLSYARRPSSTNHRSTVPFLLRHSSGLATTTSSSSASSFGNGVPEGLLSPLYASLIPDNDDASSLCLSENAPSEDHQHSHYAGPISSSASTSTSASAAAATARRKRNRASLPAYFSLLHGQQAQPAPVPALNGSSTAKNSPTSSRHWRTPSALQQLSRSLHASPITPRVAYATATFTHSGSGAGSDEFKGTQRHVSGNEERGRGRPRTRDPETRSASSRREAARSPGRSRPLHNHQPEQRENMSASQRARIDSVEKVAEWVGSSPVILGYPQSRPLMGRRNSSPQRAKDRARYEFVEAITRGLRGCAVLSDDEEEEPQQQLLDEKRGRGRRMSPEAGGEAEVRGRRNIHELDQPVVQDAPGFGNGRSGLKSRERGRSGRW